MKDFDRLRIANALGRIAGDMSDIRLDNRQDGQAESWLTIETNILNVQGSDCSVSPNDLPGPWGAAYERREFSGSASVGPSGYCRTAHARDILPPERWDDPKYQ